MYHKKYYSVCCNPNTATIRTQKQLYKPLQTPQKNKQNKKVAKIKKIVLTNWKKCAIIFIVLKTAAHL